MNLTMYYLIILLLALIGNSAMAKTPPSGTCSWESKNGLETKTFVGSINLGTVFIPRDAPIGSIIGSDWINIPIDTSIMKQLTCFNRASIRGSIIGSLVNDDINVASNRVPSGSIFTTNIPGVGISFKTSDLKLSQESGSVPFFPFVVRLGFLSTYSIGYIPVSVILIKIGEIPMGSHALNSNSEIITDGGGVIEKFKVSANITRSECVLPNSSKQISVPMGNVPISEIEYPSIDGSELKDFQIPLVDCISGSYPKVPGNYYTSSFAYLSIGGNSGSSILDFDKGLLGLNSKSTASGIAIQILRKGDSNPMRLGSAVPIKRVTDGGMSLDFQARYVKIKENPTPGTANASATFTITYK